MAVLYWGFDIEKLLTDNYRKVEKTVKVTPKKRRKMTPKS